MRGRALGIQHVVVLVNDPARLSEFAALGAQTFAPALYRATLIALMARHPDLFSLMTSGRTAHEVREILVLSKAVGGKSLKELKLGGDVLVLSVRRGGESLIPHGETRLAAGDWVTVYGDAGPVEAQDFGDVGRMIGSLKLPTLVVQEGGYNTRNLGLNARHFFDGLHRAYYQTLK